MSRGNSAPPADLAEVAASWTAAQTAAHYGCSKDTALGWFLKLPLEWRSRRSRAAVRLQMAGMQRGRTAGIATINKRALLKWPDDMAERYIAARTLGELADDLHVHRERVSEWGRRNLAVQQARTDRVAADKAAKDAAERAAREAYRRRSKPAASSFLGLTPCADASLAGRAADHLKRAFVPVYDAAKVHGANLAGIYVVGRMRLPTEKMIELARTKGFDPDEWRRVSA